MLLNGTVLHGRYRIDRLLTLAGTGGMYRALDLETDTAVAIKELIPQPDLRPDKLAQLRGQFEREANALSRLSHPTLVRVKDFFHEQDNTYLVTDFVEGETLAERVARGGAQREADVVRWAQQLLAALDYCHAQGIVHRDIKPQNIILCEDHSIKLVGFGPVLLWEPSNPRTWTATRVMGTPEYMPPESWGLQSWEIDARSDIYSLGATLYTALTAQVPLTAGQRMSNPYQFLPVQALSPKVSPQTRQVILQAIELARSKRFQSAAAMAEALREKPAPVIFPVHPAPLILKSRGIAWGWVFRTALTIIALSLLISLGIFVADRVTKTTSITLPALPLPRLRSPLPTPTATPAPTLAPTSSPTPGATQRPTAAATAPIPIAAEGAIVLSDSFDDNAHNWIVTTYTDDWGAVSRVITESVYRWDIAASQSVSRWCMPDIETVSDFRLSVDARRVSGPTDAAYGLVFRHSAGNYYLFSVRDNGYYRFSLWYAAAWQTTIDWTATTAVAPGAINRLTVTGQGDRFTFSINGTQVAEAEDAQLASGESGLSILLTTPGDAVFEFDNFLLETPD